MKPTAEMNTHFAVNTAVTLLLLVAAMYGLLSSDVLAFAMKIVITPVAVFACLYIGHRYVPRVTGPIIESAHGKQNQ